jgi:hypothetical protein
MRVDAGVPCCAGEVLAVTVGNVFAAFGVAEAFSEAKVNNVNIVLFFADANEEIVRLDVPV